MTERISEYITPMDMGFARRISWPAVFGGTLVALATELVFLSFGLFIAFQYSSPGGISLWSEIWWFVTAFCSLFVGGWVTARLSANTTGGPRMQASVTWGLTTMASFAFALWILWGLLGTSIAAVRTVTAATNNAAATATSPAAQAEANNLQRQAANALSQMNPSSPYMAQYIASNASDLFLIIFGGILCGVAGALVGSTIGRVGTQTPTAGTTATTVRDTNISSRAAGA